MQKVFYRYPFTSAAALGFVLLIPFIILEVVNRWEFEEEFPLAVFSFTWMLHILFILLLLSVIKIVRSGKSLTKHPFGLVLRIVGLVLIAYVWGGWIIDQWPCLMGVPNCD